MKISLVYHPENRTTSLNMRMVNKPDSDTAVKNGSGFHVKKAVLNGNPKRRNKKCSPKVK